MSLLSVLSGVSIVMAMMVAGFLVTNGVIGRQAAAQLALTQASADHGGRRALVVGALAERLQQSSPLVADELNHLASGVLVEDEGGKVSLPASVFAFPTVLVSSGLVGGNVEAEPLTRMFAEAWGMRLVSTSGGILYPIEDRSHPRMPLESVDEVMVWLGFSDEDVLKARKIFTACEILGVNVNTADVRCLAGVLTWQQASAATWMDLPAQASIYNTTVQIMPLPSQEPLIWLTGVPPSARRPQEILETTLPDLLPREAFTPMWNLYQVGQFSPISLPWIVSHRRVRFDGQTQVLPSAYAKPFVVKPAIWFRWTSSGDAGTVAAHRPYTPSELTQPLALGWVTPEAWFMPVMPTASGAFAGQDLIIPPTDLNVALGAAAFTGWISLQGPGPYRATSEWFTVVVDHSVYGVALSTRTTIRVFPDQPPLVVSFLEESK